jgi:enoyl-CoA hydratase/carnithine racemase
VSVAHETAKTALPSETPETPETPETLEMAGDTDDAQAPASEIIAPPPPPDGCGLTERELEPGILEWRLDRPERRNAVTPEALAWIAARAPMLRNEAVLLTGSDHRVFCAGFDLGRLAVMQSSDPPDLVLARATAAMSSAQATFIAVLNGDAIGAGVELVSACDLRVARRAARLRVPAGTLGVVYHAEGLLRMRAALGESALKRLLLLAEEVAVDELEGRGIDRVVATEELDAAALAWARKLRSLAPLSVAGNRDFLRIASARPISASDVATHEARRARAYQSKDHAEARLAVAERRPPVFSGE